MDFNKIKLVAMDLDGTITQHKSKLEDFNRKALNALSEKYNLVMIGAGSCLRIFEQMNHYPIDIIGNYGMQFSVADNSRLNILKDMCVHVDKDDITSRIEKLRAKFGFNEYAGDSVEFHTSGMITFPLIGTKALIEDKLKYDPTREKRRAIYDEVKEMFKEYTVFVGGTSSFDIAPKPYNKLYALNEYAKEHSLKPEQIVYIGDDYGIGGNDSQIFDSDISFICIDDYTQFPKIIKNLL